MACGECTKCERCGKPISQETVIGSYCHGCMIKIITDLEASRPTEKVEQ
nr:MAG: hypothetical protein [Microviridae sp.]